MTLPARWDGHEVLQWGVRHKSQAFKIGFSLFLVAYFYLAIIHQLPDSPLARKLKEPTRTLCLFFGWVQNWHLFGPEIRTNNFNAFALIGYSDGTIGSWEPPRFDLLNLHQKYCKDKFHKWDQDCVPWDNYQDFWPGLARYVGRLHYDRTNPPVWFMLLRFDGQMPDPTTGQVVDRDHMPVHDRLINAFAYHYRPEDFK